MNFRSQASRCSPIRTQMLTDLQSSSWQEKLYSSFCVIKYLILAMLGVEAALAFFIILHLRIAWAVTLNRLGGDFMAELTCHEQTAPRMYGPAI
jgi:hypothetical protein